MSNHAEEHAELISGTRTAHPPRLRFSSLQNRSYTIGQVARLLSVSPQTLRYYEKEGMVIPMRRPGGIRRYSEEDVRRLHMVRDMMLKDGLNVAGIQHLLGTLPCWEINGCNLSRMADCPQVSDDRRPCWMKHRWVSGEGRTGCRDCTVYQRAFDLLSTRRVLNLAPDLLSR
jgi:hypothetical protein